jgi:hypothetical protein
MPQILFDKVRGVWYSPDLSDGIIEKLVHDGSDWPVSGDKVARQRAAGESGGLIAIIDWASMEDEHDD